MSAFNHTFLARKINNPLCPIFFALYILFHVFCLTFAAQEVAVLTTDGDQITGSLLEYRDGVLKIRAWDKTLEIPAEKLVLVDFVSSKAQISGEAYLHLSSGEQLLEIGMEDEALEEFKAALRKSPRYADAHFKIGNLLDKRGQKKEALEYISRAIKLNANLPGMTEYFIKVADDYRAADDLENAAITYYLLYKTYPEDPAAENAVYTAGFLYAEKLNNSQKALEVLEDAITAFPANPSVEKAYYEVGRIREEEGLPEAAESVLSQLISEFPASQWRDDAHYVLGRAYLQEKRNEDAIQEFTQVMGESTDASLSDMAYRMLDQCKWYVYDSADWLPSEHINALAPDGDYIWIGTSAGITRFDLESKTFTGEELLRGADIRALAADDLYLWIGALDLGLKRYSKLENTWTSYIQDEGLSSDSASAISVDADSVWVGTTRSGVYHYDRLRDVWTNYTTQDGLPGNSIASIASTVNGVWCGTREKGGCFFDSFSGRWQSDPEISREITVTSIAAGANCVWFAWYGEFKNGVSKYDVSTQLWDPIPLFKDTQGAEVVDMINLSANYMEAWIGTDTDAMLYDHTTSQWEPLDYPSALSGNVTRCVAIVSDDSVWFGTANGLGRLDKSLLRRVKHIKNQ